MAGHLQLVASLRAATRQAGFPALISSTSLAVNAIGFMFYQK
jgi:hypothetical protein